MGLEDEDVQATWACSGLTNPIPASVPSEDFVFTPEYGWKGKPSMLYTILSLFGNTITEMKFCGYQGAPCLYNTTLITEAILGPLKFFHHLKDLTLSFWLGTIFEQHKRDDEVMKYWRDSKSSSSTALVVISEHGWESSGWGKELKTKFAPGAIVKRIVEFIGPKLSKQAKSRKGGLRVRASFALGDHGDVFDVDVWIGTGSSGEDVCLRSTEPMENTDPERRREKLDDRRWF
ncbi:uncharacterized protein MYCGRDRAFT_106509 [Zymoseptoria tritici IPO323]|uniref:Uncharacterized protein n=1 Tax=Zymoseptoria tritici (strain CBS 115943 / IPO323) TaxID=336722 RepID=F9XQ62_ZYMTI|nr:uncharacterized protein MYCGRDRAFT_106509 [Zymoseptoria tritici IPO323]EGP82708.1 hypothetical protein MYCGRDRAFT_106509 [Zymoseptoria tritici IPO323]